MGSIFLVTEQVLVPINALLSLSLGVAALFNGSFFGSYPLLDLGHTVCRMVDCLHSLREAHDPQHHTHTQISQSIN